VPFAYPLMLDVSDRFAVIIGGGAVAARKAAALFEAGATRVRVVAPAFDGSLHPRAERITEPYAPHHLDDAGLVFAATDSPEVNDRVVRDARARRLLVNRADDGDAGGDFTVPARFQEGEVIVSVSAGSPALAVAIRNDLARRIDRRHLKMAHAMQQFRPLIRDGGAPADVRRAVFRDLASDEAMAALDAGGIDGLRRWVVGRHPELKL